MTKNFGPGVRLNAVRTPTISVETNPGPITMPTWKGHVPA
jgi:hypothetical protein